MNIKQNSEKNCQGFTLTEIMVATAIMGIIMAGTLSFFVFTQESLKRNTVEMRSAHQTSMILERLVYGAEAFHGLRGAIATNVVSSGTAQNWTMTYSTPGGQTNTISYNGSQQEMNIIGADDVSPTLIGENVIGASVSPISGGIMFEVMSVITEGQFTSSNLMSSAVNFRN